MSRNRFKHSQSLHWAQVLKFTVTAGLCLVLGLSYIMCKNLQMRLADDTEGQKRELRKILKRNQDLQYNIAWVSSAQELQRKVAPNGLVPVGELLVVRRDFGTGASLARTYSPNLPTLEPHGR